MRTIWKFEAEIADQVEVTLPTDYEVIHIDAHPTNAGRLLIWALVDPQPNWETTEGASATFSFYVRGTGHEAEELEASNHATTVFAPGGLVWHIFM